MANDAEVRGALERVQESPKRDNESQRAWLDRHKDDVALLIAAKGNRLAAELIGAETSSLSTWAGLRGVRAGHQTRRPPPEPTAPQTDDYWRTRAETLEEVLRWIIDGQGRK